ncbi:MAG: hypothetical protein H7246_19230, partial [Phycisphaerae bacterium]|nr:hypothetical protein [Saprospiraceae bacterium]
MRNFFNFNKNAGAMAVLVFTFFISLSEIKAQWTYVTAVGDTIVVTVPGQGGACSERAVLYASPANVTYGWGVAQQNTTNFEPNKRFLATVGVPVEITITFRRKANSNRYIEQIQYGYAVSSTSQPGPVIAGFWPSWIGFAPATFNITTTFNQYASLGNVVTAQFNVKGLQEYNFNL